MISVSCTELTVIEHPAGPPTITFTDIQPKQVTEFKDSIVISISYRDRDGDIGYDDPNIYSLSVRDTRLENPDWYHVAMLNPEGSEVNLVGDINLKIKNSFLLGTGASEKTSYELMLRDRAGNQSNIIETDKITIVR
jgi:hypothetical protein